MLSPKSMPLKIIHICNSSLDIGALSFGNCSTDLSTLILSGVFQKEPQQIVVFLRISEIGWLIYVSVWQPKPPSESPPEKSALSVLPDPNGRNPIRVARLQRHHPDVWLRA